MIRNRMRASGFTLVELLVTVGISLALIATLLPLVKFNLDEGKVREAARQVQAFLAKSKALAAANSRVAGVWIERDPNEPKRATNLYLAEVPPPFSGAVSNSRVKASGTGPWTLSFVYDSGTSTQPDANTTAILNTILSPGTPFGMRFDYKGPLYVGKAGGAAGALTFELDDASLAPPMANSKGYPYQLYLPPQRIANQHLELPSGTFISLADSGLGAFGGELNAASTTDATPVVITFTEGGSFSRVYASGFSANSAAPLESLHLLVSRLRNDTVMDPVDATQPIQPLNDATNLWVSVGGTSGAIRTADNGPDLKPFSTMTTSDRRKFARQFAIGHDVRGAR